MKVNYSKGRGGGGSTDVAVNGNNLLYKEVRNHQNHNDLTRVNRIDSTMEALDNSKGGIGRYCSGVINWTDPFSAKFCARASMWSKTPNPLIP